ncbi:hypothetical protein OZX61_12575 (plasmid) [Acinetobacter sp. ESL0695]|uniref:dual OB domain-containing protein n=1 Tax=Acinetobacter sp. ESL0695 TaxID=2983215 RepID=UPI0023F3217F|nr:hypothetical protein [Acinetobacter sp. ESL0695]WEV50186.1 hypothetical protein OZX61_12575 [Acinetobacter sp. ESL0695]
MIKEIVVFANSVKHKNSCVAGKYINSKEWVRPVYDNNGGEIPVDQTKILNQKTNKTWNLKVLQKIKIDVSHSAPLKHQPENWVINRSQWTDHYKISLDDALNYLDYPKDLWGDGNRISYHDISANKIKIDSSLYLIKVENLNLYVVEKNDKKKGRAKFMYNGIEYDLAVTGREFFPIIEENNECFFKKAILCISLGEIHTDYYCYKLVASIIY